MKKLLTLMLAAACLAGCQKDETQTGPGAKRVAIAPVISRATETDFEENDKIGLTIVKQADESVHAENHLMTYKGTTFSGDLLWYAEGNDAAHLIAYYPYDQDGAPASFTVASDQTTGYGASDLIAASKKDVLPSTSAVAMDFKHLLTQILIDVDNQSGSDIVSIVLKGSVPTANVDLKDMSVSVDESAQAADITANRTQSGSYRAIVVPQSVSFTVAVTNADETITQKLASTALKPGGAYNVAIRVLPGEIKVTMSGDIDNWNNEGSIGEAADEPKFEEFSAENYFVYDGVRYNTVTLANGTTWMAEPLRYVPAGYTPSSDPASDSHIWYPYKMTMPEGNTSVNYAKDNPEALTPLTDEASVARLGYLYDMYVALGGTRITVDNLYDYEGARGICPPGWHIPTRHEYYDLCGATNANTAIGEASGNKTYDRALFWGADGTGKTYGSIGKANDAGFNFTMSGFRQSQGYPEYATIEPYYQYTVICGGNTTETEWFENPACTYYMTSTAYKPNYSTTKVDENGNPALTNIQYWAMMSTFTKANYPEGRLSLAYSSIFSGSAIRCIKDHEIDFYDKFKETLKYPTPME